MNLREEFQLWFRANAPRLAAQSEGFAPHAIAVMELCFHAWKASRAALVIDLHDRNASIRTLEVGQAVSAEFERCKSAVEAAGVKVKP